jgi:hypothetical protein
MPVSVFHVLTRLTMTGANIAKRVSQIEMQASLNGKRVTIPERENGLPSGKSSENRNPMDGSGVKQNHTV